MWTVERKTLWGVLFCFIQNMVLQNMFTFFSKRSGIFGDQECAAEW